MERSSRLFCVAPLRIKRRKDSKRRKEANVSSWVLDPQPSALGPAADHVELLISRSFQTSCVASLEPGSGTTWTWTPLVSLEFNQEGQLTGSNITAGGE